MRKNHIKRLLLSATALKPSRILFVLAIQFFINQQAKAVGQMTFLGTGSNATVITADPSGNYTLTLPTTAGTTGQVLQTSGTGGILSWTNAPVAGGTILAADGTAGAPGISFNSQTNTGIFRPGAGTFAISTGGTERLRINSSGNVGIVLT